eukprot:scaffold84993_cov60-Phaeocystis_antarctica.AAC.1
MTELVLPEPELRLRPTAARLSSTYNEHCGATNCVDGDHVGSQNCQEEGSSLCHTLEEESPWLAIDLGAPRVIDTVAIFNRLNCCQERLAAFEVWVGASLDNRSLEALRGRGSLGWRRCASARAPANAHQFVVRCAATARVVTVLLPGAERQLNLQEVSVYGAAASPGAAQPAPFGGGQFFLAVRRVGVGLGLARLGSKVSCCCMYTACNFIPLPRSLAAQCSRCCSSLLAVGPRESQRGGGTLPLGGTPGARGGSSQARKSPPHGRDPASRNCVACESCSA